MTVNGNVSVAALTLNAGSQQVITGTGSIQNNDLGWESTEQINVGLDLAALDGRIQFTADAYLKKTSDLLLYVPLPRSTVRRFSPVI